MKVNALAPWFGSKRTLAPIIVEQLGEHRSYIEPFCGSQSATAPEELLINGPILGELGFGESATANFPMDGTDR